MPRLATVMFNVMLATLLVACATETPPAPPAAPASPPPAAKSALPTTAFPTVEPGLAFPRAGLFERPSEAACAAACERLLKAETDRYREGLDGLLAEPDNAPAVEEALGGVRARLVPYCVERCRAQFSKAVTDCVLATPDVIRAVDCLDRTGSGLTE